MIGFDFGLWESKLGQINLNGGVELSWPGDFEGLLEFASFSALGLCPARMSNFSNFCFTYSANPENCFSPLTAALTG